MGYLAGDNDEADGILVAWRDLELSENFRWVAAKKALEELAIFDDPGLESLLAG